MTGTSDSKETLLPMCVVLALILAISALALLVFSGVGYQFEWWSLRTAFSFFRWGAYLGVAAIAMGAFIAALGFISGTRQGLAVAILSIVVGTTSVFIPWQWQQKARSVPPIHDISTDTVNPPQFVAVVALRSSAPNPVGYDAAVNASATLESYPDLKSIVVDSSTKEVFTACRQVIEKLGWQLVAANNQEGRLEATDTTRWFGFKDDVVVRIVSGEDKTTIDLRSKSRVGKSDVGANAARIREFRSALLALLKQ